MMSGEDKPNGTFSVNSGQEIIRESEKAYTRVHRDRLSRYKRMFGGMTHEALSKIKELFNGNVDMSRNDDGDAYFDVNYSFMMVDTGRSSIVPGNPQVQILPMSDDVDLNRTKTAEALVNHNFREAKMRRLLGRLNGLTMLHGTAYLKCVYNTEKRRVRYSVVPRSDLFVDPLAQTWEDVGYVIHKTVLTVAEVKARLEAGRYQTLEGMTVEQTIDHLKVKANQVSGTAAQSYRMSINWVGRPTPRDILFEDNAIMRKIDVVVVYELFDIDGNRLWHFGGSELHPLFLGELPYALVRNPFVPLVYNDALEGVSGIADMELIEPLIRQIHDMDTTRMRHAQATIPRTMVNDDAVEDPETLVADLADANDPGSLVRVKISNTGKYSDLQSIFAQTPQPTLAPDFNISIQRAEEKVFEILGISPFQRGTVGSGRVATEFALADQANQTRLSERLQAIGDLLESAARMTLDLYNEFLPSTDKIFLRMPGSSAQTVASRETLPFFRGISAQGSLLISVVPHSPAETTREARLGKIMNLLPLLTQLAPDAVNVDAVAAAIVDAAALPPNMLYTQEERVKRAKAAAQASAEFDAANGGASPEVPVGAQPVGGPGAGGGSPVPPGRVSPGGESSATQQRGGVPRARGAMVGGAGR